MPAGDPAFRVATVADLLAAEDAGRRCEIIAGVLVDKEAGGRRHAGAQYGLSRAVGPATGPGRSADHPGGWVFLIEASIAAGPDHILTPDLSGWRRERAPTSDEFPIAVAPDWVCEIVYSSHSRDLGQKPPILHALGVGHYWILDLKAEMLSVYRWTETGYLLATAVPPSAVVRLEPFDALELNVWELFGMEEAPAGP